MRRKVKIISVSITSTRTQLEDAINAQLTKGWTYVNMFTNNQNWWIIFEKTVTN
jgi:hypothetical protein